MPDPRDRLWVWRHPRPRDVEGLCVGRTDVAVDPRKAKRLASRIRQTARRHGLPRCVATSPSRRAADVGRWLRRWGWRHERHEALSEMDFGRWDGRAWSDIARDEIDAWCADFLRYRPVDGESLDELFDRVAAWRAPAGCVLVVSHGGWMTTRRWLELGEPRPASPDRWLEAPRHATCWRFEAAR